MNAEGEAEPRMNTNERNEEYFFAGSRIENLPPEKFVFIRGSTRSYPVHPLKINAEAQGRRGF